MPSIEERLTALENKLTKHQHRGTDNTSLLFSNIGLSGQLLTSNGPGTLPSFATYHPQQGWTDAFELTDPTTGTVTTVSNPGFPPSNLTIFATYSSSIASVGCWSNGQFNVPSGNSTSCIYQSDALTTPTAFWENSNIIHVETGTVKYTAVAAMTATGFTLTWTKTGSPGGTNKVQICYTLLP